MSHIHVILRQYWVGIEEGNSHWVRSTTAYPIETCWRIYVSVNWITNWFRKWFATYPATSQYMNQCWYIDNSTLRKKNQKYFYWYRNFFFQENAFKNVFYKKSSVLFRPRLLKNSSKPMAQQVILFFNLVNFIFKFSTLQEWYTDGKASQTTGKFIVSTTDCSGWLTAKNWPFVRGIYRWPVDFPHKGPVVCKALSCNDVFMQQLGNWARAG